MDVQTLKKLFIHRNDLYSIQTAKGAYHKVMEPIDDAIIKAHLEGQQTIGLYQVLPETNTIKWAVLDIDLNKRIWSDPDFVLEVWQPKLLQQAERAKSILTANSIPSYLEYSGHKGYHVWIFFDEPVPAKNVKRGMERFFKSMEKVDQNIEWELFPKQEQVDENSFGNLVKGPNGFHHKSKQYSKFIDDLTLETVKYAIEEQFIEVEKPFLKILERCSAIKNTWDICLANKEAPNFFREAVSYLFLNAGEGAEEFLVKEFFEKMKNYNPTLTKNHLVHMKNKIREDSSSGYLPIRCDSLQSEKYGNICPMRCSEIGAANSPIAFYKWASAEKESPESNNAINRLDFLFRAHNAYFERMPARGEGPPTIKQLSNFAIDLEEVRTITDGIKTSVTFYGKIKRQGFQTETDFEISAGDYASNEKFKEAVYKTVPPDNLLIDSVPGVQCAIQKYSDTKQVTILKDFGYDTPLGSDDYPNMYRSPSVIIDRDGVRKNDELIVSLQGEQFAESLDLQIIDDVTFSNLKKHIKDDLLELANFEITHGALAYTFLPVIFPFLKESGDKTRFMLFVRGETGRGKSYAMSAFQHFYGTFKSVASWTATPNSLGKIGYYYKDALFYVDDFKKRVFSGSGYSQALSMMQNFADNTARSRMNKNQELSETYIIRGWLAVTGEDTPYGEASNLARLVSLDYSSPKREIQRGQRVQKQQRLYPGITARYIHHIFNVPPIQMEKVYLDSLLEFLKIVQGQSNDIRIARNVALLYTSYKFFSDFMWPKAQATANQETFKNLFKHKIVKMVGEASDELSSERLVNVIGELLASDRIRLQATAQHDQDPENRVPVVGFWASSRGGKGLPTFVTGLLFHEVTKFLRQSDEQLAHTPKAILSEMLESSMALDIDKIKSMNGKSVRCFTLKPELLSLEN